MTALDAMAEEIERLSNLATEGPWDCWDMDEFDYHVFEARRGLSQDCRKSLMAVRWGRSHPEGPNVPRQRDPGRAANFNEMAANAELVCILRNNVPALVAALRALADMRGALEETRINLELVERPKFKDPDHGAEVEALGERIGYGALMSSAQASWRASNARRGFPDGGEFVAGPCYATVMKNLEMVRTALGITPHAKKKGKANG